MPSLLFPLPPSSFAERTFYFQTKPSPVLVITGASSGIGVALANKLGSQGLRLVLTARPEKELNAVARQSATDAIAVVANLTARDQVNSELALRSFPQPSRRSCFTGYALASSLTRLWRARPRRKSYDVPHPHRCSVAELRRGGRCHCRSHERSEARGVLQSAAC
jgi:hypothetical protein